MKRRDLLKAAALLPVAPLLPKWDKTDKTPESCNRIARYQRYQELILTNSNARNAVISVGNIACKYVDSHVPYQTTHFLPMISFDLAVYGDAFAKISYVRVNEKGRLVVNEKGKLFELQIHKGKLLINEKSELFESQIQEILPIFKMYRIETTKGEVVEFQLYREERIIRFKPHSVVHFRATPFKKGFYPYGSPLFERPNWQSDQQIQATGLQIGKEIVNGLTRMAFFYFV